MDFLSVALALFTFFTLLVVFGKWLINIFKLKHIKNPVRPLSAQEKTYLTPYIDRHSLKLRDEYVYCLSGGSVSINMLRAKGNTMTKLKFEGVNVLFPYGMMAFIQDESNTIEFVIAKATIGDHFALIVSVNGIRLLDVTELYWGDGYGNAQATPALNVLSKRAEKKEEKAFRLGQLWFGGSASILICALLVTSFALFLPSPLSMVSLVIGALLVLLGLYVMLAVLNKHRNPQSVLTVKGRLTQIAHHRLDKVFGLKEALYFTPDCHVKLMHDELEDAFINNDYDKDTHYSADITADKTSGYQLLSLSPFPSLPLGTTVFCHYTKKMKTYVWSNVVWVSIALLAFVLMMAYREHIPFIPLYLSQDHVTLKDLINENPPIGSAIKIKDNAPFVCQTLEIERRKTFDCGTLILGLKDNEATFFPDYIPVFRKFKGDDFYHARRDVDDVDAFDRETIDTQLNAANKACQDSRYFDCDELFRYLNKFPKFDVLSFRQRGDGGIEFVNTHESIFLGEIEEFLRRIANWARDSLVKYVEDYISNVNYIDEVSSTEHVILQLPYQRIFNAEAHGVTNVSMLASNSERFDTTLANALINGMQIAATDFSTMPSYIITGKVFTIDEQAGVKRISIHYKKDGDVFSQSIAILLLFVIMLIAILFVIVRYVYIEKAINTQAKSDTI